MHNAAQTRQALTELSNVQLLSISTEDFQMVEEAVLSLFVIALVNKYIILKKMMGRKSTLTWTHHFPSKIPNIQERKAIKVLQSMFR